MVQPSVNRSFNHIIYPLAPKQNQSLWVINYNMFITCLKRILIQADLSNNYQPLDFSSDDKNKFKIKLKNNVFGLKNGILKKG